MTPERKEEYKALLAAATPGMWQAEGKEIWRRTDEHGGEFYAGAVWITDVEHEGNRNLIAAAPVVIADLLAALEEAQKPFYADRQYLRMEKKANKLAQQLAEAQQTIARQREALTLIAEMRVVGSSYVSMQAIARGELIRERQEWETQP